MQKMPIKMHMAFVSYNLEADKIDDYQKFQFRIRLLKRLPARKATPSELMKCAAPKSGSQ